MATVTETLTPSETVFVHGEQFSKAKKDGVKLPRGGAAVDPEPLAASALVAAFLANEQAGALRLQVGTEKYLFGLLKKRAVQVVAAGTDPGWPAGSPEERVRSFAGKRPKSGEWTAREVVRGLFPDDDPNPYVEVATWIRRALQERELADEVVEERKAMMIFTMRYSHAVLNAAGVAAADRQPLAPVQAGAGRAGRAAAERDPVGALLARGDRLGRRPRLRPGRMRTPRATGARPVPVPGPRSRITGRRFPRGS
jgi:hypothetical protein